MINARSLTERQGDSKVMAWRGLIDGIMLEVRWMVDEKGRPRSVTSRRYQEMLQQHIWPEVQNRSSRRNYWFMKKEKGNVPTDQPQHRLFIDKF